MELNRSLLEIESNMSSPDEADPSTDLKLGFGICYIIIGLIFSPLQFICAYLLITDKDMKNPTYEFMINLSIVNGFNLLVIAVLNGLLAATKYQNDLLFRFSSYLSATGWNVSSSQFVFMAFSRWVALTRNHLSKEIFR